MKKFTIFDQGQENLALGVQATCSGQAAKDCGAENVVDGDIMSTRWMAPDQKETQWLTLDLGQGKTFNHVRMYWGVTYAASYEIETSQDGEQWEMVYQDRYSEGGKINLLLDRPCEARYVRLKVKESSNPSDAKTVLYALELYQRDMHQLAQRALEDLEIPQLTGRGFSVPAKKDGVSYGWSCSGKGLVWTQEKSMVDVRRGEQKQEETLTVSATAGDCTLQRQFQVTVRAAGDPVVDYEIYPVPQEMKQEECTVSLTDSIHIVLESTMDDTVKQRVEEVLGKAGVSYCYGEEASEDHTNLLIGVSGSKEAADCCAAAKDSGKYFSRAEGKYDRYFIRIDASRPQGDIVILGENAQAAFFGLATLEQMLEQKKDGKLTAVTIYDYSDTQYRGFIEGFYGYPWDMEDRISLMEYGKRFKMNVYIYGPKSDPYHLGSWRDDYPQEVSEKQREQGQMTQNDIRRLAEESRRTHMNFVWSVHPAMQNGVDLSSRETVDQGVEAVLRKYRHLYSLGVRGFALFVDDIDLQEAFEGSEMQAYMVDRIQTALDQAYNTPDKAPQDRVTPLFYVPSYYALDFGEKEKREHNLTCLQTVNKDAVMTITGGGCWSIVENQALNTYHSLLGRKPLMWWNYPVNDNIDDTMQMGLIDSVYSVSNDVDDLLGILSNPMNQAEASKVALFGLADYSWNTAAFDVKGNWEHSFATILEPEEKRSALRTFAENSSIGHEPVRLMKLYDKFQREYRVDSTMPECSVALRRELEHIINACDELEEMDREPQESRAKALWGEIRPWACRLRTMAEIAVLGIKAAGSTDQREKQWCGLLAEEKYKGLSFSREYETHSIKGHGVQLEEKDFPIRVSERRLGAFVKFLMEWVLG